MGEYDCARCGGIMFPDRRGVHCYLCGRDMFAIEEPHPKTYGDGINEGLERAARYHDAMADLKERVAEKQLPEGKVLFSAEATSHRQHAAAIRALKE